MSSLRRSILAFAAVSCFAVSGCLPDEKDPGASISDAGKLTGAYYAAGLGNIAVQIQNHIVGNADWFTALSDAMELDLAAIGIAANGLSAPVKSIVCPNSATSGVMQLTWIDGRNSDGRFSLKGVGVSAGTILAALRTRAAAEQVGMYERGSAIEMSTGAQLEIPASCASVSIPPGSPVIVFDIDRPAAPTSELARTEYRSAACGVDSTGRERRGALVQTRVVRYLPSGEIVPSSPNVGWTTENMGTCVDDVLVEFERTEIEEGATAELKNFSAMVASGLKRALRDSLKMDCVTASVESDIPTERGNSVVRHKTTKTIDTCESVSAEGTTVVTEENAVDTRDRRVLLCTSSDVSYPVRFTGLLPNPDRTGRTTITWTKGTATLVRRVDTTTVNNDVGDQNERQSWIGRRIGCVGNETHHVACRKIPGAPRLEPRISNKKWLSEDIKSYITSKTLGADWFGCGFFGSCRKVNGGQIIYLNKDYYTGTYKHDERGTTTIRDMQATSWIDPQTFKPQASPAGLWSIRTNYCVWATRKMIVDCPTAYRADRQADWRPRELTPENAFPVALQPGGGEYNGNTARKLYLEAIAKGDYVSSVVVRMKEERSWGRSTKHWKETAGPGPDAYVQAWSFDDRSSIGGDYLVKVRNTMLNKDPILLAHRPKLEDQELIVRRDGFVEPLRCGRTEQYKHQWPVITKQMVCGYQGGYTTWYGSNYGGTFVCAEETKHTTIEIVETTVREWNGMSYATGTWSQPRSLFELTRPRVDSFNAYANNYFLPAISSGWAAVNVGPWSSYNDIPKPLHVTLGQCGGTVPLGILGFGFTKNVPCVQ